MSRVPRAFCAAAALLVLAPLLAPSLAATHVAEDDCGSGADAADDVTWAPRLAPPVDCRGVLDQPDVDRYRFEAAPGTDILLHVLGDEGSLHACLHDAAGAMLRCVDDFGDLAWPAEGPYDLYFVRVEGELHQRGYALGLRVLHPDDCGLGRDAGDTPSQADAVALPVSCSGTLSSSDASDWFRVDAWAGQRLRAWASDASAIVCITPPVGEASCAGEAGSARLWATRDGAHLVEVRGGTVGAPPSAYALEIEIDAHRDCGIALDAGATPAQATTVTLPAACRAFLHVPAADAADAFAFQAFRGATLDLALAGPGAEGATLCLHDPTGALVACHAPGTNRVPLPATGRWSVVVAGPATGAYDLQLDASGGDEDDCGTGGDAPDAGAPVALPLACEGSFLPGVADPRDVYAWSGGGVLRASARGLGVDADLCLLDAADVVVACARGPGDAVVVHTLANGAWRLVVERAAGSGTYELRARIAPEDDCDLGVDAGDGFAAAQSRRFPVDCVGALDPGDTADWYWASAALGTRLHWEADLSPGATLCAYDPTGARHACAPPGATQRLELTTDRGGGWRVAVDGPAYGAGDYALRGTSVPPPDCDRADAGGSRAGASLFPGGVVATCRGSVASPGADEADWFVLPPAGGRERVLFVEAPSAFRVCLHPAQGAAECRQGSSAMRVPGGAATWHVEVTAQQAFGGYALALVG